MIFCLRPPDNTKCICVLNIPAVQNTAAISKNVPVTKVDSRFFSSRIAKAEKPMAHSNSVMFLDDILIIL